MSAVPERRAQVVTTRCHRAGGTGVASRCRGSVVALGPEGGWTDDEVALLEAHGFARLSLGPRILRTDTAAIAVLARLMPVPG